MYRPAVNIKEYLEKLHLSFQTTQPPLSDLALHRPAVPLHVRPALASGVHTDPVDVLGEAV